MLLYVNILFPLLQEILFTVTISAWQVGLLTLPHHLPILDPICPTCTVIFSQKRTTVTPLCIVAEVMIFRSF